MEEKKTNEEQVKLNEQITHIDNLVDDQKYRIKRIDEMHEQIASLNKNLNLCISLLAKAVSGATTQNMFNDMYDNNRTFCANMTSTLDDELSLAQKNISKLTKEKEKLINQFKKEMQKEMQKEE